MPLDPAANFIRGTTDSSVASADTTISVADASIFPDPSTNGEYNLVLWDADTHPRPDQDSDVEIVRCTSIDTTADELTVARGQEGTSDASHPSGAALQLSPTAKMFGDIESEFDAFWDAAASELTADVNTAAVSTDDATVGTTLTDPAAVTHTGELADASDVSGIQSSSDVDHDSTTGGTVSDAHHSKTSSASELSDVSADSASSAHHLKTASGDIDHDQTTNRTHSGDNITPQSVSANVFGIAGFEQVEKDGEIDVGGEQHGPSNKVTYTINDTGKDAYILVLESFGTDNAGSSNHRLRYNGYGSASGEDDYEFVDSSGQTKGVTYLGIGEDIGVGIPFSGAWLIEHYDGVQDSSGRNAELSVTKIRGGFGLGATGLQAGGAFDHDDFGPPSSFQIWEDQNEQYTPNAKVKVLKVTYL